MSKKIPRNLMSIDISMILYEKKGYKKGKRAKEEKGNTKERLANQHRSISF